MNCIRKYIPNSITCLNLFSGCVACVLASESNYFGAALFIMFAALFDFLDGFSARLLKAFSPIGKELDSLSDLVSFGVAPSFMLYSLFLEWTIPLGSSWSLFPYLGFVIAVFSGLRLAKFNIDTRQANSFIGLPVPANALFWCALIVGGSNWLVQMPYNYLIVLFLALFSSWMLVSEVPMFSLKFKHFGYKGNELRYVFLLICIVLLICFQIVGLSFCIVLYILLSICNNKCSQPKTE